VTAEILANGYNFRATGSTIRFDGFLRVYTEGKEDNAPVEDDEKPTRVKPIVAPQADVSESLLPPNATPNVLGERYEILGLIGMGGMGAVYRARDVVLSEIVALKLLRPVFAADGESLVQFCQEVRLARRVTHKNVARTYDLGEADGQRFLTMELVEGQTLGALLDGQKLSIARTIEIAQSICEGVAAAHDAGVVHRDLKPENVAIAPDGRVVVMDFGIARHVGETSERAGFIVGTPEYMAPEQAQGAPDVDGRADQYAIGTMMFEMLTTYPGPNAAAMTELISPTFGCSRNAQPIAGMKPGISNATVISVKIRDLPAISVRVAIQAIGMPKPSETSRVTAAKPVVFANTLSTNGSVKTAR